MGDIEKAFFNIGSYDSTRDCFRYLWIESAHEKESKLIVHRLTRVVLGVNISPFFVERSC